MTGEAKVCDECGAFVADEYRHDTWHYEIRSEIYQAVENLRDE